MSIVTVTEVPAGTAEQYERFEETVKQGAPRPLVHIAGPVEGGWRVINVWASQEDVDAIVQLANRDFQSHGISVPDSSGASVKRTKNPVYRLVINAAATAGSS